MAAYAATLWPALGSDDAHIAIGPDRLLRVGPRGAGQTADEVFQDECIAVEIFDGDRKYLGRLASFKSGAAAVIALPALVSLAKELFG